MEIRILIISESGQTTPYEFKTYQEATDFLLKKFKEDGRKNVVYKTPLSTSEALLSDDDNLILADDVFEVDPGTITSTFRGPIPSHGVMHTLRNKLGLD